MSRAAIPVGASAVLVLDRGDADEAIRECDRARSVMNLGGECDSQTRNVMSSGDYFWHRLSQNRLGAAPRIGSVVIAAQWANGSYIPADEVEDFTAFCRELVSFWEGPCRPLRAEGYPLPTAGELAQAAEVAEASADAIRIVREDPNVEVVEIADSGAVTATTTAGEVYSIGQVSSSEMSTGGKVALGLGIAATVVGLVYLLFRGRR